MTQNTGPCQSCHKDILPGEDRVICPECGAPYHRECYQHEGQCVYADKHASGYEYRTPVEEKIHNAGKEPAGEGGVVCPACQTVNSRLNIFCEHCGKPLHADDGQPMQEDGVNAGPLRFEEAYGYQPKTDLRGEIDGISKADWAVFIGSSAPAYLPRMAVQAQRNSKMGFFFSSFLFSTFYLGYRKLWKWFALALVSFVVLNIPGMLWTLGDAGIPLLPALSQDMLYTLSVVAGYLGFLRKLLFGFFSLYLYRTDAAKKIHHLQEQQLDAEEYRTALRKTGGVSPWGIVIISVLFLAFSYWLMQYGGDAIVQYVYSSYGL